ncbi:MAG: hypothetical protein QXI16_04825 [Sulfolobaceae archaeon]
MASPFTNLITRTPLDPTGAYEWDYQVTGYFIFRFLTLPAILGGSGADTTAMALCTGTTIPNFTIASTKRNGIGGIFVNVPTSGEWDSTYDFKFADIVPNNSPTMLQLITQWFNSIRNFWTGTADPVNAVTQNQYKAIGLLVTADPTFTVPYFGLKFFGTWPTSAPYSNYTVEVTTNDIPEYTVTLSVDRTVPVGVSDSDVSNTLQAAQSYLQATNVTIPATVG